MPLPALDLRSNLGTWAVVTKQLPAVAFGLSQLLPTEKFDPAFQGQDLTTTYFDTQNFTLRKTRASKKSYLVMRLRCYQPENVYALSAKTESEKFRQVIPNETAEMLLDGGMPPAVWPSLVPANLVVRLIDLLGTDALIPVVATQFKRFAVEDENDRFTLDVDIATDTGKRFGCHVLEFKSTQRSACAELPLSLRPIKLSKFLWSLT